MVFLLWRFFCDIPLELHMDAAFGFGFLWLAVPPISTQEMTHLLTFLLSALIRLTTKISFSTGDVTTPGFCILELKKKSSYAEFKLLCRSSKYC